eukprot:9105290-Pyramimonas_sp.AAC.1
MRKRIGRRRWGLGDGEENIERMRWRGVGCRTSRGEGGSAISALRSLVGILCWEPSQQDSN